MSRSRIVSMSEVTAGYQTVISVITSGTNDTQRILAANPQRYAVRFYAFGLAAFNMEPTPGPIPAGYPNGTNLTEPIIYKWSEYPSWVAGEWYCQMGIGTQLGIWECIKVG